MIEGIAYRVFAGGGATLLVGADATIVNVNAAPAGAVGLDPVASGDPPPQAGDATGLYADQGLTTLFDPYPIDGTQVRVESYESWDNVAGGAVFTSAYLLDDSTQVANFGQISSSVADKVTRVIDLDRGAVENFGTIWADNVGTGAAQAVLIGVSGTVSNSGDIIATADAGDAIAIRTSDSRSGVSIDNTIDGYVSAVATTGYATGIDAASAGIAIHNDGIIEVAGGAGAIAVDLSAAGGTLINDGEIYASGTGSVAIGIGVANFGPGALFNAGLISADVAVLIKSSAADPYTIDNSGTIEGSIVVDAAGGSIVSIHNSGTIAGDLLLAGGDDFYDGDTGRLLGAIDAGAGADRLIGGAAADVFQGGDGSDLLSGGAGADRLTGGAGVDTFQDTAAGLNGDTITDFSVGDKIVIADAALAGFAFSLSGNTLTYTGGSLILTNLPGHPIVASAAAGGGVQLTMAPDAHNDINGDGFSDILWRNDNGQFNIWGSGGGGNFSTIYSSQVSTGLVLAGTGDFNGDGREDILWRNETGQLNVWQATDHGDFTTSFTTNIAGNDWHIVGTGDFNGDGKSGILWRNDSGQLNVWEVDAAGNFTTTFASTIAGNDWHVVGTGDFNGDGLGGILWRNDNGQLNVWDANPDGTFTTSFTSTIAGNDWHVVGTGDFNGDGLGGILWRNDSGQLNVWEGNPDGTFSTTYSAMVSTDLHLAGVGDFNGDAADDLVWRNDSGQIDIWQSADGGFHPGYFTSSIAGNDWHVQDPFL